MIRIVVPGVPRGWQRPADGFTGGRHRFTPKKMRHEQAAISYIAASVMAGRPLLDGPVDLRIGAFFPIPKSWPKWRRIAAEAEDMPHVVKPDASNIVKLLEDALNRVVWTDDARVCDWGGRKRYSLNPRLVIEIRQGKETTNGVAIERGNSRLFC